MKKRKPSEVLEREPGGYSYRDGEIEGELAYSVLRNRKNTEEFAKGRRKNSDPARLRLGKPRVGRNLIRARSGSDIRSLS